MSEKRKDIIRGKNFKEGREPEEGSALSVSVY